VAILQLLYRYNAKKDPNRQIPAGVAKAIWIPLPSFLMIVGATDGIKLIFKENDEKPEKPEKPDHQ
jgi:hypothetical protein